MHSYATIASLHCINSNNNLKIQLARIELVKETSQCQYGCALCCNVEKLYVCPKGILKSWFHDYAVAVGNYIGVLECVMYGFRDSVVGLQPLLLSFISE